MGVMILIFLQSIFCGRRCCKTSICISCCRKADDSPAPTLSSSLLSSPLRPPLLLGNSFSNLCYGCWFSSISPFATIAKSINDLIIFLAIPIPFTRGMHWPTTVFTVLTNWLLGRFCVACLPSILFFLPISYLTLICITNRYNKLF